MNEPLQKKDHHISTLATGAGVSIFGRFLGGGFDLVNQVIFARVLGAEGFGLFSIGWTILRLLQLLAPLGVDKAALKFGSPCLNTNDNVLRHVIKDTAVFTVATGLLAGTLLFVLAPWLANQVFNKPALTPVLQCFAMAAPLSSISRVAAIITRISQKMHYSVFAEEFAQPLATLICLTFIWHFFGKLFGAVIATTVGFIFAFVIALFFIKKLFPEPFKTYPMQSSPGNSYDYKKSEFLQYSFVTFLASTFLILTNRVDRLIVGVILPAGDVGIYQAISQVCTFFPLVLSGFGSIITPLIATLYYNGANKEMKEIYIVSTKWGLYITTPILLTIIFIPDIVLSVFFGNEYRDGWAVLIIILAGQFVALATGAVSPLMTLTGHERFWLIISLMTFILNVILTYLFAHKWGLVGAAAASSLTVSLLYIAGLVHIKKSLGFWPYDSRYWKGIAATLASIVALYGFRSLPISSEWGRLILMSCISALTFILSLLLLRPDEEDKTFIKKILRK